MKPFSIEKQLMTLDEYEKELLDSIENEEWIPVYETSEQFEGRKAELMEAARETLIDVTITTKKNFYKELLKQDFEKENYSESTFFSSEPIDIGYTDARMLDGIIAGKK